MRGEVLRFDGFVFEVDHEESWGKPPANFGLTFDAAIGPVLGSYKVNRRCQVQWIEIWVGEREEVAHIQHPDC